MPEPYPYPQSADPGPPFEKGGQGDWVLRKTEAQPPASRRLGSLHKVLGILIPLLLISACTRKQPEGQTAADDGQMSGSPWLEDDRGVPIEARVVRSSTVEQGVPLAGVFEPFRSVDIVAEIQGKVEGIFGELGDAVTPRDTLAVLDDRIPLSRYRQAKSQVLSAENNLKIARLNFESDRELLKNGDISNLTYESSLLTVKAAEADHFSALANLSLLEKQYRDTRITSPIAGLISRKYIDLGTMATPNMPLYRVVDLNVVKVEVGIPQSAINRIRVGDPAGVTVSALNGRTFDGSVRTVSPQADEQSGAFTAEIHVKNTEGFEIRAGMTARVDLILTDRRLQLTVPDYALVSKNGRHYVYRITDATARLTGISVAETVGSQAIVESGLAEGDTIVVVGMKNLGVETKVWIETIH